MKITLTIEVDDAGVRVALKGRGEEWTETFLHDFGLGQALSESCRKCGITRTRMAERGVALCPARHHYMAPDPGDKPGCLLCGKEFIDPVHLLERRELAHP